MSSRHPITVSPRLATAALVVASVAACSDEEERPQWLLWVDTDAPLTAQLASQPELPRAAAIDTLRIDILDGEGRVSDSREIAAVDPRDWPLSFGVIAEGGPRVRVRLRAFRAADATPDFESGLVPPAKTTIDRLVLLEGEPGGKATVGVRLSFACLGVSPSFVEPPETCVDGERRSAPASEALATITTATAAGSSPLLADRPCRGLGPPSAVCVPGGFSVVGDARLSGIADALVLDSAPPIPVFLSPMWMDRFELSVGEIRHLVLEGLLDAPPPLLLDPQNPDQAYCTWLGPDVADNDAYPVSCVGLTTAEAVCRLRGGRLPTESEWEHAARGRGHAHPYPWGSDDPACCVAQAGRATGPCGEDEGPAVVGAYIEPPGCPNGDVSRDGVVDLGGNLIELTSDAALPYDAPCWQHEGIAFDPRCDAGDTSRIARGGSWNNSLSLTHAALRKRFFPSANAGFRCVYEDVP